MTPPADTLDDLRREIDRLDDAVLDLLCERTALVRRIARVKGDRAAGGLALRPAREAAILRRLVARADGRLPAATVVAMWRELLAATTAMQTPLTVAVWAPEGRPGLVELARGHFGCLTPLLRAEGAGHALRALAAGTAQLAVLPMPDDSDPWWRGLVGGAERKLHIVGRLPFGPGPGAVAGGAATAAAIVAPLEPEPSGDDITLLAIEAASETSCTRIVEALGNGGLAPAWRATVRGGPGGDEGTLHLLEVDGFLSTPDPALAEALAPLGARVLRVATVGSYARPLPGPAAEPR